MAIQLKNYPAIPEYFSGKCVFLTGATGFIGKVLIEKLLRSCPQIDIIYMLMREKRGETIEERLEQIIELPLFDEIRKTNTDFASKLRPIQGDVLKVGLGLSATDREELIRNVHIVYHMAASVRFDDTMRDAILMNVRGTREVCQLVLDMNNVEVVLHLSTTYCQTDRAIVDERMYPALADWREIIDLAETADTDDLEVATEEHLKKLPNTYTFSKSLAEHVVNDMCARQVPVIIVRPSIVISTRKEPFPGWVDNFNGPIGLLVGAGKGIVRTMYCDPNVTADYIPVDIVVKGMIMSVWERGICQDPKQRMDAIVYNASANKFQPLTMGQMINMGKDLCWETPLNNALWFPGGSATKCRYYHYLRVLFYHLIPALIIDGILKLMGQKPILMRIQRTVLKANMALKHFVTNEWTFINENAIDLENKLLPEDLPAFTFEKDNLDVYDYFKNASLGARRYLLKEDDSTLPQAKVHIRRLYALQMITSSVLYLAILWFLYTRYESLVIFGLMVYGLYMVFWYKN